MYPTCITVRLDENQFGYAHSKYYRSPQPVYVKDRFDNLALGRPVLMTQGEYREQLLAQAA